MQTLQLNVDIANPNHPKLGDTIKVEPIRTVNAINKLRQYVAPSCAYQKLYTQLPSLFDPGLA